jgi:hypothetical protein|tara:strand:+ start:76 stop:330 length:255 start_codon:yes stop_codon:yes gene_type:complete
MKGREFINRFMSDSSVTPVQPIHILSDYTRTYDLGRQDVTSHITHSTTGNGPVRVSEVNYITYTEKGELTHAPKMLGTGIDLIA